MDGDTAELMVQTGLPYYLHITVYIGAIESDCTGAVQTHMLGNWDTE